MNKILAVALLATLSLLSIGCATTQPTTQTLPEPVAPTAKPSKTHIMYYWVHSPDFGQMLITISGQFYWQDYCLYLLNREGKFVPTFPELPKDAVYWNEQDKTLTMTNKDRPPKQFTFKMGDVIYTNGRIIDKKNIDMNNKSPEIQKCLASASGIAELGTIDIEKYDLSDKR